MEKRLEELNSTKDNKEKDSKKVINQLQQQIVVLGL